MVVSRRKNKTEQDSGLEKRRRQLVIAGAGACTVREDVLVDATRANWR